MLSNYDTKRDEVGSKIYRMGTSVLQAQLMLFDGIQHTSRDTVAAAAGMLSEINTLAVEVDNSVVEILARFAPEAGELRLMVVYLKIVNNIVRVSDNIKSMSKRMLKMIDGGVRIDPFKAQIEKLYRCVVYAFELSIQHLDGDLDQIDYGAIYRLVVQEEECSDRELRKVETALMEMGQNGEAIPVELVDALHIVRKLERIADRAVDIARLLCYAKEGGMIESV